MGHRSVMARMGFRSAAADQGCLRLGFLTMGFIAVELPLSCCRQDCDRGLVVDPLVDSDHPIAACRWWFPAGFGEDGAAIARTVKTWPTMFGDVDQSSPEMGLRRQPVG
ncbi:hypothetical protein ACLOJK_004080 [Asimina triloba]